MREGDFSERNASASYSSVKRRNEEESYHLIKKY
jgi:hypothetical protein